MNLKRILTLIGFSLPLYLSACGSDGTTADVTDSTTSGSTDSAMNGTTDVTGDGTTNGTTSGTTDSTTDITNDGITSTFPRPNMINIPAGSFDMGSPVTEPERIEDEGPQFSVNVPAFRMGETEVTFDQYYAFATATGRDLPAMELQNTGNHPVAGVSWQEATDYAVWLTTSTSSEANPYRLPTEAEWEYAARAGTTTPFHTGQTITSDQANFRGTVSYNGSPIGVYRDGSTPVGSFAPNAFGLRDMLGNVSEYTCSEYTNPYSGAEQQCVTSLFQMGVLGRLPTPARGGNWFLPAYAIRSAVRLSLTFGVITGFRVAQD